MWTLTDHLRLSSATRLTIGEGRVLVATETLYRRKIAADELITSHAPQDRSARVFLNAGRGNPNWRCYYRDEQQADI